VNGGNDYCTVIAACVGGGCSLCGTGGLPCCEGDWCTNGGCCVGGTCVLNGTSCGITECVNGSCSAGTCGSFGQPCCANTDCTAPDARCLSGECQPCGGLGERCCLDVNAIPSVCAVPFHAVVDASNVCHCSL
jgi:hypothetical protein